MTRENVPQLDAFKELADGFGAQLRLTRLRPSGRGADVWDRLHPTAAQQRELYEWLLESTATACSPETRSFTWAGTERRCPG